MLKAKGRELALMLFHFHGESVHSRVDGGLVIVSSTA